MQVVEAVDARLGGDGAPVIVSGSKPAGVPSSSTWTVAASRPHVDHSTSAAITSEAAGSTQSASQATTATPAVTAATEPAASDAMWMKAPRRFRLWSRWRASSAALTRWTSVGDEDDPEDPPRRSVVVGHATRLRVGADQPDASAEADAVRSDLRGEGVPGGGQRGVDPLG